MAPQVLARGLPRAVPVGPFSFRTVSVVTGWECTSVKHLLYASDGSSSPFYLHLSPREMGTPTSAIF